MAAVAVRTPLREGDTGPVIAALQAWLNPTFPSSPISILDRSGTVLKPSR